jgi:dUTPase
VDTQISIAVPAGTYGRVAPRSGLGMSDLPVE